MAEQIQFNQGDEYIFRLNGFNPEHNYAIYIQMFDEDGNFVGQQLETTTNYSDSVEIVLPASYTDSLTVPAGEDYQLYYMGGKQAEIEISYDEEDTEQENPIYTYSGEKTIISDLANKRPVIVFKKRAEGPV